VRFVADDIIKLRSAAEDALAIKKGKGRPFDQKKWTDMWLAVIKLILAGELKDDKYKLERGGQKHFYFALKKHFQDKKTKLPLGLKTFGPEINRVLEEFVEDQEHGKNGAFSDRS
tara:strand:+ start:656 stop:1000 length:345 start_codon:yes stop_codon:yes gene_type:complete